MNENLNLQTHVNQLPVVIEKRSLKFTRATVPLETLVYNEIKSLLPELSDEIGSKVNMPAFLRKTILENWKIQIERYRKLNPTAKQPRH